MGGKRITLLGLGPLVPKGGGRAGAVESEKPLLYKLVMMYL